MELELRALQLYLIRHPWQLPY